MQGFQIVFEQARLTVILRTGTVREDSSTAQEGREAGGVSQKPTHLHNHQSAIHI